jgi:hypothetical protein
MPSRVFGPSLTQVSLVAATGGFLFGYDTAVINGANQYVAAHFDLNPTQEGLAAASAINDSPAMDPAKTVCIYATVSLAGLIFTFFLIPETKGRRLEEIEVSWNGPGHLVTKRASAV